MTIHKALPFVYSAKKRICFREAASIMQIAQDRKSKITIEANDKIGSSTSILSIINLGIMPGDSCILRAEGENPELALSDIIKVLKIED